MRNKIVYLVIGLIILFVFSCKDKNEIYVKREFDKRFSIRCDKEFHNNRIKYQHDLVGYNNDINRIECKFIEEKTAWIFFSSTLDFFTGECYETNVIIAYNKFSREIIYTYRMSSGYPNSFINIFRNIECPDREEKISLCNEISSLYSNLHNIKNIGVSIIDDGLKIKSSKEKKEENDYVFTFVENKLVKNECFMNHEKRYIKKDSLFNHEIILIRMKDDEVYIQYSSHSNIMIEKDLNTSKMNLLQSLNIDTAGWILDSNYENPNVLIY